MKVIGLCGGSGSGKGAVCGLLHDLNIPVIDTDAIYHELTSFDTPCLRALRAEFGESIIKNGVLHRPTLARIVFSSEKSEEKRKRLNSITHGYVLEEVRKKLREFLSQNAKICVMDVPLLFESGFDKECDLTVAVIADREIRLKRITERDGITIDEAKKRINSQLSNEELIRLTDMQITNNSDISALKKTVSEVFNRIKI